MGIRTCALIIDSEENRQLLRFKPRRQDNIKMDFKIKWNDAELMHFVIRAGSHAFVSVLVAIFARFLAQLSNY